MCFIFIGLSKDKSPYWGKDSLNYAYQTNWIGLDGFLVSIISVLKLFEVKRKADKMAHPCSGSSTYMLVLWKRNTGNPSSVLSYKQRSPAVNLHKGSHPEANMCTMQRQSGCVEEEESAAEGSARKQDCIGVGQLEEQSSRVACFTFQIRPDVNGMHKSSTQSSALSCTLRFR